MEQALFSLVSALKVVGTTQRCKIHGAASWVMTLKLVLTTGRCFFSGADALESTTNSRCSGLRVDAGRHLFSEGEKNVALSCSFNFNTFLASFHAASRAHRSCHSVSS